MSILYDLEHFFLKPGTGKHNIPDNGYGCSGCRQMKRNMSNLLILTLGGFTGVQFIIMLHNPHRLHIYDICVQQVF